MSDPIRRGGKVPVVVPPAAPLAPAKAAPPAKVERKLVNRGVEKLTEGGAALDPAKGIAMVDDGKVHEIKVTLGGTSGGLRLADVAPDLAQRFPAIA